MIVALVISAVGLFFILIFVMNAYVDLRAKFKSVVEEDGKEIARLNRESAQLNRDYEALSKDYDEFLDRVLRALGEDWKK